ncbi:MAG: hypothetical protein OJF52_000418 [Nitrospira sp.]|jgi:hypothetical protein|nr:MAG: hypothetical protein OJF52_000418 [Nitrospira sp.]
MQSVAVFSCYQPSLCATCHFLSIPWVCDAAIPSYAVPAPLRIRARSFFATDVPINDYQQLTRAA